MDKKTFVSRLKPPSSLNTPIPSTSSATSRSRLINTITTRPAIIRRSKSMTELGGTYPMRNRSPLRKNLPVTKSTANMKPPIPGTFRVPLKTRENNKPPIKRPGPAIDADEVVKPKVLKPSKPAPYDYKARYNLLNEKHLIESQKLKDVTKKLAEYELYVEKYNSIEKQCQDLEIRFTQTSNERDKLQVDYSSTLSKLKSLETEHCHLRHDYKILSDRFHTLQESSRETTEINKELSAQLSNAHRQIEDQSNLVLEYRKEAQANDELRRNMHNQIQDLKGTIRVFCRIRPSLQAEASRSLCIINYLDENTLEIKKSKDNMSTSGKVADSRLEFAFDKVFPGETPQSHVFEELAQLVQSALDGYHVCVFAYGQTGSGKTYTMQGECTDMGLGMIPRSVILIFELIRNLQKQGWVYEIECNFLEIYNETIRDLLDPNSRLPHDIMFNEGRGITVTNLTNKYVKCAEDLLQLIEIANRNRAVAVTNYNEHSSRSHAVTRINISGLNNETSITCRGSLNLVDLAGSESAKTSCSERLTETKNINKSLSMLGTVICALHNKESHIPYRNSKLTFLLQSSLCGNAKALMFVNIAPLDECYNESVSSLRFAAKVKEIKMSAKRNKLYLKKE